MARPVSSHVRELPRKEIAHGAQGFEMKKKHINIPARCGVYQAVSENGYYYIGRSVNMRRRVLQHIKQLQQGSHKNPKWQHIAEKHGCTFKWSVLAYTDSAESAIAYERHLLELYWNDEKLINVRKGDAFEVIENERSKRKPKYIMNVWTKGYMRVNFTTEWQEIIGKWRLPNTVEATTLSKCYQLQHQWMLNFLKQNEKKFCKKKNRQLKGYHIRNIYTGYIGYARTTHELRKINALASAFSKTNSFLNGWQVRRIGSDWSWNVPNVHSVAVYGLHVTGKIKQWKSQTSCESDLGHGANMVFIGKLQTYKGWALRTDRGWHA